MSYLEIEKVIGREILDSRGNPTVEAEVLEGEQHLVVRQQVNLRLLSLGIMIKQDTWEKAYQRL